MKICGTEKSSLVDYEDYIVATVFTGGCNLRCPFCQNASLVLPHKFGETVSEDEVLGFLKRRKGILDGVCISGGEPTLQGDLSKFIEKIRAIGYKRIKLDTNGTSPETLAKLIGEGLIDYCAMDIKNSREKYALTVGLPNFDTGTVEESASILMDGSLPYEFRTTVVKGLHTLSDIVEIGKWLDGADKYYLQKFSDRGDCISPEGLSAFSAEEMKEMQTLAQKYFGFVGVRGI